MHTLGQVSVGPDRTLAFHLEASLRSNSCPHKGEKVDFVCDSDLD